MYNKILVPLDGSTVAEKVLGHARFLAHALALQVELLHVVDPIQYQPFSPPVDGLEYLEKIAASFERSANVQCTVKSGNPPAVIVDAAAEQPGMLIAMSTHGYTGAKRWLMGSVAERVLDATKNHLLLVRPGAGDGSGEVLLKAVIAPLDGSEVAERALPTVAELAKSLNLEVTLLRVVKRVYTAPPEAILPVFGTSVPDVNRMWQEARSAAEQYLTDKAEDLRSRGVVHVTPMALLDGVDGAAAEIIDLANRTPHNVVVMSTHGASGLGRWVVGSVTQRVVRHSTGPVLVIR